MKKILVLEEGTYYNDRGCIVAAGKSKSALVRWIKKNRPGFKRNNRDAGHGEIYFENDDERTWLRHQPWSDFAEWVK